MSESEYVGVTRLEKRGVAIAHVTLTEIRRYVHHRFGASVGPVWVMAVSSEPTDEELAMQKSPDKLLVKFGQGSKERTLAVMVEDLGREGVEWIGVLYDRISGPQK